MSEESNLELEIGDWRLMNYGYEIMEFYVYQMTENHVKIGLASWLVSDSIWMDREEFLRESQHMSKGRFRWWRLILPIINNGICPFSKVK